MTTSTALPLLLSIPHAGLDVPAEVAGRLAINATTIYNECDLWANELYDFSQQGRAPDGPIPPGKDVLARVTMPIARVLIDANRPPDDWGNWDGAVKTQSSYEEEIYHISLSMAERQTLQQRYWQPFHQQLEAAIIRHAHATEFFLDCHNMAQQGPTGYGDANAQRPLICLANFGNRKGEPKQEGKTLSCSPKFIRAAAAIAHELFADLELLEPDATPAQVVAINRPFAGGYILAKAAKLLAETKGSLVPSIMIEINRGLFVGRQQADTPIAPPNQARIAAVRARIVQWAERVLELTTHEG